MMNRVTQSVIEGLQTVMLAGYADIAQDFAANLQNVDDVVDFRIVRTDGNEAFLDNKTIEDVNRRKKEELFETREDVTEHQILVADDPDFRRAVSPLSRRSGTRTNVMNAMAASRRYGAWSRSRHRCSRSNRRSRPPANRLTAWLRCSC
jgi:hypothetical protein